MTLAQLGEQYLQQEKVIRGRIKELNAQMHKVRGRKMCDLSKRIAMLYSMALDTHRTGVYLINYYKECGSYEYSNI